MQAYCLRCRKKVEARKPEQVLFKNKRTAMRGSCPTCNTKVFRISKFDQSF